MQMVFRTEPNPQDASVKPKYSLRTLQLDYPSSKLDFTNYVDTLNISLDRSIIKQLETLRIKHLQLGGALSGFELQKKKIIKDKTQRQTYVKNSFQNYLLSDIQKFKSHKQFFSKHFKDFTKELNSAIQKRDKLSFYVDQLRSKLKQIKQAEIKKVSQSVTLPSVYKLRTSKTLQTTEPTERSIRMNTDRHEVMSPMLMRIGGSQPVIDSRIHQPIKAQSTSSKKQKRRQNVSFLKCLLEQRQKQKDNLDLSNFQRILFQRRNFSKVMEFFQCIELS